MAGNFTPTQLLKIQMKAEQMWTGGQFQKDFEANTVTAQAVLRNQTAQIRPLSDPNKENAVVVSWIKACGAEAQDCVSNCDLTEPELDTLSKEYTLDICKKDGFSIDEEKIRTNIYGFEELAARGVAKSLKTLDEYWSLAILAKLKAFAGRNFYPAPYTFDIANNTTNIPTADYTRKIVAYWIKTGLLNKISDFYFIDNGTLFTDWLNAQYDSANSEGRGDAARRSSVDMNFDMFNFPRAGLTEDTFLIGRNAVAVSTKTRHTATPRVVGGSVGQTLYTVPSPSLPGVNYDVYYTVKCITVNNKAHYVDTFRFETQGGIFLNPEQCPIPALDGAGVAIPGGVSPTGILSFTQTA